MTKTTQSQFDASDGPEQRESFVRRHARTLVVAAVVLAGLGIFVVVWFQPQKLVIDARVDEEIPVSDIAGAGGTDGAEARDGSNGGGGSSDSGETDGPTVTRPATLRAGRFLSLEHDTSGRVKILRLGDGRTFLRFEDLSTSNGPDLRVYLSEVPAGDDWYAYGERFVDLGALKGNLGNQNYVIPANVDLSGYKSAVIWCRRFAVGFGVAPLERTL
jgi:hypothetical protein